MVTIHDKIRANVILSAWRNAPNTNPAKRIMIRYAMKIKRGK